MKLAIFASGNGSNFAALLRASQTGALAGEIALLVCDRAEALVIERAKSQGIATLVFNPRAFETKAAFEKMIAQRLVELTIELVVLAGYMRLIGPTLLAAYEGRIINLHPSLLPLYPGKAAIEQAYNAGDAQTGITIHYVDAGMDTGRPIAQFKVPRLKTDTLDQLEERIHQAEYKHYPAVIQALIQSKGTVAK
ncbi:phosphoribosylglycinamide formyltransferase [Brochothrix campestris]|uniref:Phosphoribosylglycinamide formyltransferase n=1 Tax=Brochothrix campestris FSL F6-1037 TaxID=1265861 RepID=W7CUF9_9LIST|nr:phosphoribosylglycinamide formyltransferase [Brochothrix campestris]EUJ40562.1 phosphoribosylglycinamide formyltransferase [Brochothrix campestris FSL F6-1037]